MDQLNSLFQDPPADVSPGLSGSVAPARPLTRRQWAVVLVLWFACFVPRAGMTFAWPFLWSDSVTYLRATEALEKGDFDAAFETLGLNVFPAILLILRATGIDWTVGGAWWSTWIASLVVLPLFGLVRRQFNDQIAVVACLLYAIHPTLVGFSPLIIRDSTFWFLFTLTLYFQWRALTEIRWRLFLLAGISLTLAAYTRTEGWLLIVPLALWFLGRLPAAASVRSRLVLGTCATLVVVPLLVILVNITLLRNHSRWEWGYNQCIAHALRLVSCPTAPPSGNPIPEKDSQRIAAAVQRGPSDSANSRWAAAAELVGKLGSRVAKSFTYTYGLLLLIGLWKGWRVFLRRDQQALFAMNLLLLAAITLRNSLDGIDIRYFLPIVIVGAPYMALGLIRVVAWCAMLAQRCFHVSSGNRLGFAGGLLLLLILTGWVNTIPRSYPFMREEAELGRWIVNHVGPNRRVAISYNWLSLIEYYAQAKIVLPEGLKEYSADSLLSLMQRSAVDRPDVVLLRQHGNGWLNYRPILQRQEELGYRCVPQDELPGSCRQTLVLVRRDVPEQCRQH